MDPDDASPRRTGGRATRPRRLWGPIGLVLAVLVVSAGLGIGTARTDGVLGPHLAHYETTLDHQVTVDLGPLGTVTIDSPLPAPLGVRVEVREIPAEVTTLDQAQTLAALSEDVAAYVQFFGAPEVSLAAAAGDLIDDAVQRAVWTALLLAVALAGTARLLGPTRRAELASSIGRHRGLVAAGTGLSLVLAGTLTASQARPADPAAAGQTSAVFDGTPLEGARVTGRLAGLIDTYGGYALDAYRSNEAYYADAADAVAQAWADRVEREQAAALLDLRVERETVDLLLVSDLHCNVGMAAVIRRVAELAEVDLVVNAGDSTVDGTAVESYCVQAFAAAVPDEVPYLVADGNHDSALTSEQEADAGAEVLDGAVVEVAGLRVLGDGDPNETRIGVGTRPAGDESLAETGHRLADLACADGEVDLLVVHTPAVGDEALDRGCVPVQLSGHLHTRHGPVRVGESARYISGSTAGARLGEPTVGPLQGTAELTVIRFAPEGQVLDQRLVQVEPSGAATVGPWVSWPSAPVAESAPGAPV